MGRKHDGSNASAWTIAAGVLMALVAFSALQRCQQIRTHEAAAEHFRQAVADPDPLGWQRAAQAQRRNSDAERNREKARSALKPDERCIDGRRFKVLENGFQQMQTPC